MGFVATRMFSLESIFLLPNPGCCFYTLCQEPRNGGGHPGYIPIGEARCCKFIGICQRQYLNPYY